MSHYHVVTVGTGARSVLCNVYRDEGLARRVAGCLTRSQKYVSVFGSAPCDCAQGEEYLAWRSTIRETTHG